jgi:hypothetical protein
MDSSPLTDAAETLRQSSPQLLHLADLLGRLRFNEVAHLGDAGPRQLPQTGPEQSADNGEGARRGEGGASCSGSSASGAGRRRLGFGKRATSSARAWAAAGQAGELYAEPGPAALATASEVAPRRAAAARLIFPPL